MNGLGVATVLGKATETAIGRGEMGVRVDALAGYVDERAEALDEGARRDERFEEMVVRQARFMFQVAFGLLRNRQDAEDAVQEAFLKLYRTDGWLRMESEKGFLARTVWRVALDHLPRASEQMQDVSEMQLSATGGAGVSPEQSAVNEDERLVLRRLIDGLPEELRQPLVLSSIEEMTSREVAEVMGIPEGTVRTRVMRARTELRRRFVAMKEVAAMNEQMKFDEILDEVLRGFANPEPTGGLQQRVMRQVRMARTADGLEEAAAHAQGWSEQPEMASGLAGARLFETGGREEGIFGSLWSGVRELLFPAKLPPLALESRPIAVVDRMAPEKSYPSTAYAVAAHVFVIVAIGFAVNAQIRSVSPVRESVTAMIDPPNALRATPKADAMGGGGGQRGLTPVSRGALPKLEPEPLAAPKIPPLQTPMLAIESSVDMQKDLKSAALPDLGVPNSPLVNLSMGDGRGGGMGPGNGNGVGPGSDGNTGGGVRRVGGGVSAPEILYQPEPEFSEEARKAKLSGNVEVYLWVDERGNPTHVRVVRGIGMGLDEKAAEAVRQYRFKPAMVNGKPVTVEMFVDVVFQIM